jgi:hypothetical protein
LTGNHDLDHNTIANALNDIITELGPAPSGASVSVDARFDTVLYDVAGSVDNTNLAGSITGDKLVNGTISATQLGTDAVETLKIKNDAVTSDKILNNTIVGGTTGNIAQDTITAWNIAQNAITNSELAGDAVRTEHILNRTILAEDIAQNTITANEIGPGAVDTSELANDSVTRAKIDAGVATRTIQIQPGYRVYNNAGPHSTSTAYLVDLPTTINGISMSGIVGFYAVVSVTEIGGNGNLRIYANGTSAPSSHSFVNYGVGGYPIFNSGGFIPTDGSGRFRLYPQTANCGRIVVDMYAVEIEASQA